MPDYDCDSLADTRPDRELVRRFLETRGESEFRTLYRRHTPSLYRMAYRLAPAPLTTCCRKHGAARRKVCPASNGARPFSPGLPPS